MPAQIEGSYLKQVSHHLTVVCGGEPCRPLRAQPDGGLSAEGLPRHQELHRRQAGDGGREREAGEQKL